MHVGEPTLDDPKRTVAPDVTKQDMALYGAAVNAGKPDVPATAITPTGPNEPPRSDVPSTAPVQLAPAGSGTSLGVSVVSAPSGNAAGVDPNAVVKAVGPVNTALPAAEGPAPAPDQVNDIKPGAAPAAATATDSKKKKAPKADLGDESSSKKKKKKGIGKLNPF